MPHPRQILLLCLAACAGSTPPRAATPAPAESIEPCSCPPSPADELDKPTRDDLTLTMMAAAPAMNSCFEEERIVVTRFTIDGASGQVTQALVASSSDESEEACAERVLRSICFPRFRRPDVRIEFPFRVGHPDGGEVSPPHCAASAAPAVQVDPEEQREVERNRYRAQYGVVCERALAERQSPPPADPPRELDNATKRPVLQMHIDDVQSCYLDALAGWPDLQGKLELQVVISGTGHVESSRVVSSTFPIPELGCCLRQVFRSPRFPAAPDGSMSSATYDFAFKP